MKEFVYCVLLPLSYLISIACFVWCLHRYDEEVDALSKRVDENKKMFDILVDGLKTYVKNKAPLTIEGIRERLLGKSLHYFNRAMEKDVVLTIEGINELSPLLESGDYLLNGEILINIVQLDALAKGRSVKEINYHGETKILFEIKEETDNDLR